MKKIIIGIVIFAVIIVIAAVAVFTVDQNRIRLEKSAAVSNFEQCAALGNPIMESYPEQCRTIDGRTFARDIGNELEKQNLIIVDSPRPGDIIRSPLAVTGKARGYWFFEATFSMDLYDDNGQLLGQGNAQAQGEWTTEDFVPFTATLEFTSPTTSRGNLIIRKDNPSGLPEHDDQLRIPVKF